jgi:aldose 1-epimerase
VKRVFGSLPDGRAVHGFVLMSDRIELHAIEYGAIISELWTPDRQGVWANVVLGYSELAPYLADRAYLGAVAGRYANRIAGGRLPIDGTVHRLSLNENGNHLHGGTDGFHCQLWHGEPITTTESVGVTFTRTSADGESGYPGNMEVTVQYLLTEGGEVLLQYGARTDAATVANLTQHTYFNLAGQPDGAADEQELRIAAHAFTPVDRALIPTGEMLSVDGSPFDFRQGRVIAEGLADAHPQLAIAGGFDHNWVLSREHADGVDARLRSTRSGRSLDVLTSEPGLQFYDGHLLPAGTHGAFPARAGVCLETQHFPDSPNHPGFPSTRVAPGEPYQSITRWRFSVA